MDRGREFIGGEFARLLQDWYWPTEGLAPAEVQVYGGDACLVIGKLLTNHSPLLENDDSSKPVPGYNPGHTLGTGDQEPHTGVIQFFSREPPPSQFPGKITQARDLWLRELLVHNLTLPFQRQI
ncbi:hypothetical protein DSO57_1005524 [Entomophthora muscae]|uniref:Uncharacterized protein n=1 Tax=Entomophthora muscae TaxID=34485 RepID=A0ACC2SXE2_9FUNG|nr:hypothetical protein DSO57_1005524 [Entomophthora muscae]